MFKLLWGLHLDDIDSEAPLSLPAIPLSLHTRPVRRNRNEHKCVNLWSSELIFGEHPLARLREASSPNGPTAFLHGYVQDTSTATEINHYVSIRTSREPNLSCHRVDPAAIDLGTGTAWVRLGYQRHGCPCPVTFLRIPEGGKLKKHSADFGEWYIRCRI